VYDANLIYNIDVPQATHSALAFYKCLADSLCESYQPALEKYIYYGSLAHKIAKTYTN